MSQYPRDIEQLLSLAKQGRASPALGTSERVRQRVTATVAGGAATAVVSKALAQKIASTAIAQGVAKGGLFSSMAAKLTIASAVVVTAGTLTVASIRPETHAERRTETVQSQPREERVRLSDADDGPTAERQVPVEAVALHTARVPAAKRTPRPPRKQEVRHKETLHAEMQMLNRASSALIHGEARTANVILASYRSSFSQPKLQEEHDGLRVIADCLLHRVGARQRARHFLDRASTSLLAPRLARACDVQR